MKLTAFEAVTSALGKAKVRFLVAGGLAVNAHGYMRTTFDVDLVIQLDADNIAKAFKTLETIDYKPSAPVTAEQFSDPKQRNAWIKHKHMQVLNFHSPQYPHAPVDVFVTEPFDFNSEYKAALVGRPLEHLVVRFVSIPTLIKMKQIANRPKDLDDIEHLHIIVRNQPNNRSNGTKKR